jgi:hypothetical protein
MAIQKRGFQTQNVEEFVLELGETPGDEHPSDFGYAGGERHGHNQCGSSADEDRIRRALDVITHRQVNDIAMNGRNTFDLLKLIPGINSTVNGQVESDAASAWNVNGTRVTDKQMTVDGVSNVIEGAQNRVQVTLNPTLFPRCRS